MSETNSRLLLSVYLIAADSFSDLTNIWPPLNPAQANAVRLTGTLLYLYIILFVACAVSFVCIVCVVCTQVRV